MIERPGSLGLVLSVTWAGFAAVTQSSTLEQPILKDLTQVRLLVYVDPDLPNAGKLRREIEEQLRAKVQQAGLDADSGEVWLSLKTSARGVPGDRDQRLFVTVTLELVEAVTPARKTVLPRPIAVSTWSARRTDLVPAREAADLVRHRADHLMGVFLRQRASVTDAPAQELEPSHP